MSRNEAIVEMRKLNDRLIVQADNNGVISLWYQAGSKKTYDEIGDTYEGHPVRKRGLKKKK